MVKNMALAISFRSESCDHYVFAFDGFPLPAEVINAMIKRLDTEVAYLYIDAIDSNHENKVYYHKIIKDAVIDYIESLDMEYEDDQ